MRESVSEALKTAPAAGGVVTVGIVIGIAGSGGSMQCRSGPAAHRKWSGTGCDLGRIVA